MNMQAFADGAVVDKIYNPYVETLEREIEYRFIVQNDDSDSLDGVQLHRLGLGLSWTDRWFSEVYLIGERTNSDSLSVEAYELETKWQITEQGEFWADWGLLFELEAERDKSIWEYGTTLLTSKEWGRWVTTANLGLIYEWGSDIANEWETTLSVQGRYRLSEAFEPALEFYTGQDTKALGPVFTGLIRTGGRTKLRWEVGLIFGLDTASPDQTFRGLLEFEF
ncbi:MAG: hypothetical protein QGH93_08740 [Gammaproteobacteria bacterium]|jgi:hypothetical protein|nr:hypothetical protein [Gammaproteobacteria bacterium]